MVVFTFVSFLGVLSPTSRVLAEATATPESTLPTAPSESSINAQSVTMIDADTGEVVYTKNPYKKLYPASVTKLLTVLILLENCDLDDEVVCGDEVTGFTAENCKINLQPGEKLTVEQMAYACLLPSANDAAAAAAVHVAGSIDAFAGMMNERAKQLGLEDSNFVNPHGIHDDDHYTTTWDMSLVAKAALENETMAKIMKTGTYTIPETNKSAEREIMNTNCLIVNNDSAKDKYLYSYATGMKTGTTYKAGTCLAASAKKDGKEYIAVIFNAPYNSGYERFNIASTLFDYAFELNDCGVDPTTIRFGDPDVYSALEGITLKTQLENFDENDELNGMLKLNVDFNDIDIKYMDNATKQTIIDNADSIVAKKSLVAEPLYAPIAINTEVGTVSFYYDDEKLATGKLVASRDVAGVGGMTAVPEESQPGYLITPAEAGDFPILWILIPALLLLIILIRIMLKRRMHRNRTRRPKRRRTKYYSL